MNSTPNLEGIKRLRAGEYPIDIPLRCLQVFIPDDDKHLWAFAGFVSLLTLNWAWMGTPEERASRAQLWKDALNATLFEDCMDCEDVADCIAENEAVQAALAAWFSNAVDNDAVVQAALERAFNPATGGGAIPDSFANSNLYGAANGCDNDDGWGHIRDGLIERSFQRVIDALELIASITDNAAMLAEFVNAIPAVGAFFDVIPVTDWIQFFDNVRDWMLDQFVASDNTDLRDEIACDLFCIWQLNCSLSLDQIRDYYWNKTRTLVPAWDSAFDSFVELGTALSTLSTINFGSGVVYALVGSQYGFLTFLNDWFGIHIDATRNDLALGDPSDDWVTLCDTCPVQYCDTFTPEIGEFSYLVGIDYQMASYNVCAETFNGQVGGDVQTGLGIDGGNAVVGVIVCTTGATIAEACVVVDFEEEIEIRGVSMQHMPYGVTGGNRQYIRLLDDTGVEVESYTQEGSNLQAWHTFAIDETVTGVRYIVFSNTQNGGAPRIGQICVVYMEP